MTKIKIEYPHKVYNYGPDFGRVACEAGFPWGILLRPTDGTGKTSWAGCDGVLSDTGTGTSNVQKYMQDHHWDLELGVTDWMMSQYPTELASKGAGNTQMDRFKSYYVDRLNALGIKWWIGAELIMDNQSVFNYQSQPSAYEARYGQAMAFCEALPGFQGYIIENMYENGLLWLHPRPGCVSQRSWDGFGGYYTNFPPTDHSGVNVLRYTDASGKEQVHTALQHIGLLDELVVEFAFDAQTYEAWLNYIATVRDALPDLPIMVNVDMLCIGTKWSGTPLAGTPTDTAGADVGYWLQPQGSGYPNRCEAEKTACVQKLTAVKDKRGIPYDGINYCFFHSAYPYDKQYPDIQFFLEFADQYIDVPGLVRQADGGDIITTYLPSTSNEVSFTVTEAAVATQLVITLNPATATAPGTTLISGTLKTVAGVAVANALIQLQRNGTDVTGKTATTSATGTFSISMTEPVVGTYLYKTTYAGGTS